MHVAIIKKYNKTNGTTYVYDSVSYWDKEKKQPRSKRKLIGKIDPDTGEIVPTGGRGRSSREEGDKKSTTIFQDSSHVSASERAGDASESSKEPDYKSLYEECRQSVLELEANEARLKACISRLEAERREFVVKLQKLAEEYGC